MLVAGGGGAFLKLGSFGFGFGVEKKDASVFASFTAVTTLVSFLTVVMLGLLEDAIATFFTGGNDFVPLSLSFRFFVLSISYHCRPE